MKHATGKAAKSRISLDLQPNLKGELIELRPLTSDDWNDLFAVASDPLIWEQHPESDRYKEDVFKVFFREAMESGGAFVIIDKKTQQIIGSTRFYGHDPEKSEIEIGWTFLARKYWGGRYNRELKQLMLDHAFKFVENVVFYVGENNIRSRKATEKIGAIRDGLVEKIYGNRPPSVNVRYLIKKPLKKLRVECEGVARKTLALHRTIGYKAAVRDGRKGRGKTALSRKIRQAYQALPYPAVDKEKALCPKWRRVLIDWIYVLWQPARRTPDRVLVAGCGTGAEAFSFRQRFPGARIVGVDYSDRALAIARKLQRNLPRSRQIHFVRADFAAKNFKEIVGGEFDLISCHGVLTYVPDVARALQNLANCLTEDGALYLGVNGSRHFSATWRPALRVLGLKIDRFADGPALRKTLKICDALTCMEVGRIAKQDAEYLSSDLFTPLIANLPLNRWETLCRAAGLHFLGSKEAHRTVRRVVADNLYELLLPRSRTELYELAERIAPSAFHRLVFTAKPAPDPPWQDRAELLRWRVFPSVRRSTRWPKISGSLRTFRNFTIKSPATNTIADIYAPQWVLKILEESNGIREVREILGEASSRISSRSLRKYLYLLYLLAFINLQPPLFPQGAKRIMAGSTFKREP